jgi:lipoyl(octanoyl) transferase
MLIVKQEPWGTPVFYPDATAKMGDVVVRMVGDLEADDMVWFLEHPDTYTVGSMGSVSDIIINNGSVPVLQTDRGGKVTHHCMGQRVVYAMINLRRKYGNNASVGDYVFNLEEVLIRTLKFFDIASTRRPGLPGVWVSFAKGGVEQFHKIASLGIRVKKWITYHGFALNVNNSLVGFGGIVPCGIQDVFMTSMLRAGLNDVDIVKIDQILLNNFLSIFDYHDFYQL